MERILRTFKIWAFFGKIGFFEKNLEISQNRYMWQIFSRQRLKWYFFLENVFPPYFRGFFGENLKKNKIGKVRKYDGETEYLEKKRFHPSKRHLKQCWRAQSIPEVAGCLVPKTTRIEGLEGDTTIQTKYQVRQIRTEILITLLVISEFTKSSIALDHHSN